MGRNGYNNSILSTENGTCFICGKQCTTVRHEIFGASNRQLSKKYGLWVNLCPECHNMSSHSVHMNAELRHWLQDKGQRAYEEKYGDNFADIFGKNYKEG